MFNFLDYFANQRSAGTPATGINVDPAPMGISETAAEIAALTKALAGKEQEIVALKEQQAREDAALLETYANEKMAGTIANYLTEQERLDGIKASRRTANELENQLAFEAISKLPQRDPIAEIIAVETNKLDPELLLGTNKYQSLNALVEATLAGKFGNGEARRKALGSNYAKVQQEINERLGYRKSKKY